MTGITINYDQLMKALQLLKMKRAPRGCKAEISTTTHICGGNAGEITVFAPTHTTKIQCDGTFPFSIVADASQLRTVVSKLPKAKEIQMECTDNQIIFRINAFQLKYTPHKVEKL